VLYDIPDSMTDDDLWNHYKTLGEDAVVKCVPWFSKGGGGVQQSPPKSDSPRPLIAHLCSVPCQKIEEGTAAEAYSRWVGQRGGPDSES